MSEPKKKGTCAYCGKRRRVTRDHIPPRSLFKGLEPDSLITVPCCTACRSAWSKDDEYFKTALLTSRLLEGANLEPLWASIERALQNPAKKGFAQEILKSIEEIEVETPGGIYLGQSPALRLKQHSFYRVCRRILRGLFYTEYEIPVPPSYTVSNAPQQGGLSRFLEALPGVVFPAWRTYANGDFAYTHHPIEEDPLSGVWVSVIYKRVPFVGFILDECLDSPDGLLRGRLSASSRDESDA